MSYVITLVPADRIPRLWPVVADMLVPAIEQADGRYTPATVRAALVSGSNQLWVVIDKQDRVVAAITTGVIHYPAKAVLGVNFIGGEDMHGWVETLDECLRAFASDLGLAGLESVGRPGWSRILRRLGWSQTMVMVERDVDPRPKEDQEQSSWVKVVAAASRSPNPASINPTYRNMHDPTMNDWHQELKPKA